MKNIITLILVSFLISSCNQNNTEYAVPNLLDRPESLQYSNEWSEVKNKFADLAYAIKKDKKNIDALIQISNLYISEARVTGEHGHYYNAALEVIEKALTNSKISKDQKFMALSSKASVQLSLHEFDKGLKTAETAMTLNPYNARIYGVLVDANVELGNYAKAVEYSDKMVSLRPDITSYSRVSYLREIHGMPKEAIEAMKMAVLSGSPGSEEKSWAALQLAQLYQKYGKLEEAENILQQILMERENYPFALAALGEIYIIQKKYELAEKTLKEACQIIPEVGFYISLAELYKLQGRNDEMKVILKEVLAMLKEDTDHGHDMSLEFAQLYVQFFNDPDKSLQFIKEDMKKRPSNIDLNRILARIYIAKEDKTNASLCIEKAKVTKSQHPELKELEELLMAI